MYTFEVVIANYRFLDKKDLGKFLHTCNIIQVAMLVPLLSANFYYYKNNSFLKMKYDKIP